jgi:hypothetical protein
MASIKKIASIFHGLSLDFTGFFPFFLQTTFGLVKLKKTV